MPSCLRDEAFRRSDPYEHQAQLIYLLCVSHERMRRTVDHEKFIEELAERLRKLVEKPPGLVFK